MQTNKSNIPEIQKGEVGKNIKKNIMLAVTICIALFVVGITVIQFKQSIKINAEVTNQEEIMKIIDTGMIRAVADKVDTVNLTGLSTGENVTHTCMYERKYNNEKHWEECFICHTVREEQNHTKAISGKYGCAGGLGYQREYCEDGCGYSKELPKQPHTPSEWRQDYNRHDHIKACTVCGNQTARTKCRNENGELLGCATGITGTCATCGLEYNVIEHSYHFDSGKCNGCGKKILEYTSSSEKVGPYTTRITWKMKLLTSDVVIDVDQFSIGSWSAPIPGPVGQIVSVNKNETTGEYTIVGDLTFSEENPPQSESSRCFGIATIDGKTHSFNMGGPNVNTDNIVPEKQSITVQGSGTSQSYSRKAIITAKFTKEFDGTLQMALFDEEGKMISNWETASKDGATYTKNFDVILEAIGERTITVKAKDNCGNTAEGKVKIAYLDSKAPTLTSGTTYNTPWAKERIIKFEAEDDGAGDIQIGFNTETDYKTAIRENGKYTRTYKFVGDVYQDVVGALYLKDSLGNSGMEKITIGKIDNTAPTITNLQIENKQVKITAHDRHKTLGEGSGVVAYKYKTKQVAGGEIIEKTTNKNTINIAEFIDCEEAKITPIDAVGNEGEEQTITLPKIKLTIDTKGGNYGIEEIESNHGSKRKIITPTRQGYNFVRWELIGEGNLQKEQDGSHTYTYGTENATLQAIWEGRTDIPYIVRHYQMNVTGENYELVWQKRYKGTVDTEVPIQTQDYRGFITPEQQTIYIKPDGTAELNYYYKRQQVQVKLNKTEGIEKVIGEGTYYYEQTVIIDAEPKEGYRWNKWTGDKELTNKRSIIKLGLENIELTANGLENKSTLTIEPNGGSWRGSTEQTSIRKDIGATESIEEPTRQGYNFIGWKLENGGRYEQGIFKYNENDAKLTARWRLNEEKYNYLVEYYYDGEKEDSKTDAKIAQVGTNIKIVEDKIKTGYKLEKTENLPLQVVEDKNQNIIKIYYTRDKYNYWVEYYYNKNKNENATIISSDLYNNKIEKYKSKNKAGYELEKEENVPLTITEKPEQNKMGIYYEQTGVMVEAKYLERGTNKELAESEKITGELGQKYKTQSKEIQNYELVKVEGKEEGLLKRKKITVAYYYAQKTTIKIQHIDKETDEILSEHIAEGLVGDTYAAASKDLENYIVVEKPEPRVVELTKEEQILKYYYQKVTQGVIEKHIDKETGDILNNTVHQGEEGTSYQTKEKEFEGYDLTQKPSNAVGNMINGVIEVKYYYRKKAELHTKYKAIAEDKVLEMLETQGHENDEYETEEKQFEGYILVKTPKNATGKMQVKIVLDEQGKEKFENITNVEYIYTTPSNGVIVEYKDKETGEVIETVTYEGNVGDEYVTLEKEYLGYDLVEEEYPENAEGEMQEEQIKVTYYYRKKAYIIAKYVNTKTGGKMAEEFIIQGNENDEYETEEKKFLNYDLIKIEGQPKGKMKATKENNKTEVIYYYGQKSGGVTQIHKDIITGEIIHKSEIDGVEGQEYKIEPLNIKEYDVCNNKLPENSEGKMTKEEIIVEYYYIKKATVEIKYIDKQTKKEIAEKTIIQGHEQDDYKTESKEITYYKLKENSENTEGKMEVNTYVIYYYEAKEFDLKLEQNIEKIIKNGEEQIISKSTSEQNKAAKETTKAIKQEIVAKQIKNTDLKIQYKVSLTNTGELEGKATITEKIPEGMIMTKQENSLWAINEKQKIATLESKILKPGETEEYIITLKWENTENNFGSKINIVSISKTQNEAGFAEKDISNNEDKTEIIISVKTGIDQVNAIIITIIMSLIIIIVSIILIKNQILG